MRIFAAQIENTLTIMAKPIAQTPVLKGQAAIDFIQELSQNKKASEEETIRINKGAERINAMLSFSF